MEDNICKQHQNNFKNIYWLLAASFRNYIMCTVTPLKMLSDLMWINPGVNCKKFCRAVTEEWIIMP